MPTSDLFDEADTLLIVDRSTLERYTVCPAQARFIEAEFVNSGSTLAAVGDAVHAAFGDVIAEYVASEGSWSGPQLQELVTQAIFRSRPDVQPAVYSASKASLYHWSRYISAIHHDNILRFDGGKGDRSGQLAWDLTRVGWPGALRVTAEIDFLHATASPEVVSELDWKSGWKVYRASDVADSFQFQVHAWLIFAHYPLVQAVEVRVWNTKINRLTYCVEFERDKLDKIYGRIITAAETYIKHRDVAPLQCEVWPTPEKCRLCDAAAACPASGGDVKLLEKDPGGFVDELVALTAKLKAMQKMAAAYVKKTGSDIVSKSGNAFGSGKPRKPRETTSLYHVGQEEESESENGNGDAAV